MDKWYYISQGETPQAHLRNIEQVCLAGIQLIQLRMKTFSQDIYLETAIQAKAICDRYQAKLIINDNIEVAKASNADGIHLGKQDSMPNQARKQLDSNKIIGGTANTLEDCLNLVKQDVDYIGLGPFRFTETKQNLSPILGLEGYIKIIQSLQKMNIHTPIYAIGGITTEDYKSIFETGIYGVAISGLWSNKSVEAIKQLINESITNSRQDI